MMPQPHRKARGQRIPRAPFDDASAAVILRTLKTLFAHWQARLLHRLHDEWATRGIAKADDDDGKAGLWQWVDVVDSALDRPSTVSMHDIAGAMANANAGAAGSVVRQIDLDDPLAISLRTHTEATNYAAHRSAEMIGQITDTMRDVLRKEIRDAVGLHWDVDKLADRLEQTEIFSDQRAEMIARTEVSMAQNQGVLEAGRQARAAGLDVRKAWELGPNPCPACEAMADENDIDLDTDFGDETSSPPLHPNCECSLNLFVGDGDEEEEAKMDDIDANGGNGDRHVVDTLADLIAEAGTSDGQISRQDALRWLLHSRHGQALIARVTRTRKRDDRKDFPMTRTERLTRIVRKAGGLAPLCQRIVKRGHSDVSEAELTGMATELAKHEFPGMDDAQAFTRLYTGNELLRRAIMIAKAEPMPEPEQVDGDDVNPDDPGKALAQLRAMIDELRRHAHHLSESQLWDRVTRENPRLAKRAIAA
jgi:hypothetical protein